MGCSSRGRNKASRRAPDRMMSCVYVRVYKIIIVDNKIITHCVLEHLFKVSSTKQALPFAQQQVVHPRT